MKKLIKKIVRRIGVWDPVQKWYSKGLFLPYAKRQTWALHISGTHVVYDTSDAYSRHWFYPRYGGKRLHEPIATKIFTDYIQPQDVVLDIGAHLGYFTCLAAALAPHGQVYAFDTDLKSCQLIEKNAKKNALQNIHICHAAVSDQAGVIKIKNLKDPNPGLVINSGVHANSIEVPCMRIDDFIDAEQLKPNFIKIDIEGAEALALSGMEKTLQIENLTLLVEIHVNHLKKYFNTDYKEIIELLLKNNFKIENIDHRLQGSTFETVHANTLLVGNTMLLCTKNAP
ncbi:FkbM family methyltransferase [Xanthomarina sp. F2636L]|uniref:FkbM family methyltransferase n=1 Tax=Xanthomarina sp. F2636L TaxID=2996018 RepID=UPI00225E123B|nr:FkbM family methyltransferase [Xanthomarina sp. F2636L]MCX7549365.1 FkbM family methyltransferase [Xanthomarina sp. F2636L]